MCGIVGFTGRENATPVLLDGLKRLEYRGYDSAGVVVYSENELKVIKKKGEVSELCKAVEESGGLCLAMLASDIRGGQPMASLLI